MKKIQRRVSEIQSRLRAIADMLEKEKRSVNDEEKREIAALEREQDVLMLRARSFQIPDESKKPGVKECFRALCDTGRDSIELRMRAEGAEPTTPAVAQMLTEDVAKGGLMPVTSGEIVNPLRENLIYDKVGIRMPVGCRGNYEWPVVEAVTATIAGENVNVGAKKVNLSKVGVTTQRLAVVVEATRESLFNSDGKLEGIIREQMPLAVSDLVNQIIVSPTKVTADCAIQGPFVGKTATAVDFTYKGLNKVKAGLLAKGLSSSRMCWIMTEATKAELESTPKDAGSGVMIIEDDKLCGLPVFCSSYIGEGNIGLGDFTYQVCGQFGDFYLVIDPYTGAGSNTVKFALNVDFGTATLRPEAFVLVKSK